MLVGLLPHAVEATSIAAKTDESRAWAIVRARSQPVVTPAKKLISNLGTFNTAENTSGTGGG